MYSQGSLTVEKLESRVKRVKSQKSNLKCYAAGFEDRSRGQEPKNTSSFQKLDKVRKKTPLKPPEGYSPANTLI